MSETGVCKATENSTYFLTSTAEVDYLIKKPQCSWHLLESPSLSFQTMTEGLYILCVCVPAVLGPDET